MTGKRFSAGMSRTRRPYRLPPLWARLSVATALLAAAGSVVGLLEPELIYGRETPVLYSSAIAQDLANLFLVAPLMLVLTVRASRGSRRSWLCLIGFLAFTAYNYAIYAFSIHFGPLFLVWVTVLGLSVFAAAGSAAALPTQGTGHARRVPRCACPHGSSSLWRVCSPCYG